MPVLHWIREVMLRDKWHNTDIRSELGVKVILRYVKEIQLRKIYGYVMRMPAYLFRECLCRRNLQPVDGIVVCFMEAQQAAIQLCNWARVDNV